MFRFTFTPRLSPLMTPPASQQGVTSSPSSSSSTCDAERRPESDLVGGIKVLEVKIYLWIEIPHYGCMHIGCLLVFAFIQEQIGDLQFHQMQTISLWLTCSHVGEFWAEVWSAVVRWWWLGESGGEVRQYSKCLHMHHITQRSWKGILLNSTNCTKKENESFLEDT